MRLTLAIVGKTLFDTDVEQEADSIGGALTELMELFRLLLLPYSEYLEKLPLPPVRRFQKVRGRLDEIIFRIIAEHRRSGVDRGDLLSMLLLAQDEDGGERMTDTQLRDEAMTIFLAGHETTANALTWAWYLLSEHPEVEATLHNEIDAVVAADGRPQFADLARLPYTEMVLTEAMRLYPPAWVIGRLAIRDYEAGGYLIPAGSLVFVSQYTMHRDRRYYSDPERFDPERWTPEARSARPPFAYFPFGGGPRRCIGEGFAWMEGVLLIATLARHWRLRLVPDHPVKLHPRITLRPKYGMRMILERR